MREGGGCIFIINTPWPYSDGVYLWKVRRLTLRGCIYVKLVNFILYHMETYNTETVVNHFSRSFPQNPPILSSPGSASIPSWQLDGAATPTTHKTKSTKSSLDEEDEGEAREHGAANWDGSSGSNRSSGSEIEMIGHESGGEFIKSSIPKIW